MPQHHLAVWQKKPAQPARAVILLVHGRKNTDYVQGYTSADFVVHTLHPTIGCISHHANKMVGERLWFPSEDGVMIFDGTFHHDMKDLRTFFRDDYLANLSVYENSIAGDDRFEHVYKLLLTFDTNNSRSLNQKMINHQMRCARCEQLGQLRRSRCTEPPGC